MTEALKILLINWQDRENPEAGGAEIHLHETFGRLAARGHDVRAVVGGWPGAPRRVTLDGIEVTRAGTRWSFPLFVRKTVRRVLAERAADIVVEDINKVPVYAPRWIPGSVVALVPHLFGSTAFREVSWPLASLVWGAELLIPNVYRGTPFEVISNGTAEDLVERGIERSDVVVIPPGIDHATFRPSESGARESRPTILYVGRLKRYKGIDVVLRSLVRLRERVPDVRLEIAGRGDDRDRLEALTDRLGVRANVRYLGYISEDEKVRKLQRAWVAVYPSPKEGWGIVNVEAAACGTPVVASDSPGLRESVDDGHSGHLVPHRDVDAWAAALEPLLTDSEAAAAMRDGCIRHASRFSWDRAADETERHLRSISRHSSGWTDGQKGPGQGCR
ncbi:MAG: glycosyltransferase family 4 protein [Gemmatimonadota bacterium]|nr:glycosyltransferase family 4 protein [Gemmatimonadota bacterium]